MALITNPAMSPEILVEFAKETANEVCRWRLREILLRYSGIKTGQALNTINVAFLQHCEACIKLHNGNSLFPDKLKPLLNESGP